MFTALVLQLATPTATAEVDRFAEVAWGFFARSGALSHRRERVDIAVDGRDGGSAGMRHYKLRLVTTDLNGRDMAWTNSRTCPAVRTVIASLRDLQPPRPMPPGFEDGELSIVMDGTQYQLSVPVTNRLNASKVTWRSNVNTPLARWVDNSLTALALCWSPVELRSAPDRKP